MATATTNRQFEDRRDALWKIDPKAGEWLAQRDPNQWSRAYFGTKSKCDILLNNICECFNSVILEGRQLGIVAMCDWIFEYVMKRFQANRDMCDQRWG